MQFRSFIGKVKSSFCRSQEGLSVLRFQSVGPTQPVQLTEKKLYINLGFVIGL